MCRVNCCNTERTGPGQRLDNWGSPEEKDTRCMEILNKLNYIWIKIRQEEGKIKDRYIVVEE